MCSADSPLSAWSASFKGNQKCVELLINAGANIDGQEKVSVYLYSCTVIQYIHAHLRDLPVRKFSPHHACPLYMHACMHGGQCCVCYWWYVVTHFKI